MLSRLPTPSHASPSAIASPHFCCPHPPPPPLIRAARQRNGKKVSGGHTARLWGFPLGFLPPLILLEVCWIIPPVRWPWIRPEILSSRLLLFVFSGRGWGGRSDASAHRRPVVGVGPRHPPAMGAACHMAFLPSLTVSSHWSVHSLKVKSPT